MAKVEHNEDWIQHEVNLRVHDYKFNYIEKEMSKLSHQIIGLYALIIGGIILPVTLHYFHLI